MGNRPAVLNEQPIFLSPEELADMEEGRMIHQAVKNDSSMPQSAVEKITEYLEVCGYIQSESYQDKAQAERDRHRRYIEYSNIDVFLKNYRRFRKQLELIKEDLVYTFSQDDATIKKNKEPISSPKFFDALCQQLDVYSATEEKMFERRYVPKLKVGRKIECAIEAINFGLRNMEDDEEESYAILHYVYIDGKRKPTIQETINALNLNTPGVYYSRLEKARKILAQRVFGASSNKAELLSILVYFRQQEEDLGF